MVIKNGDLVALEDKHLVPVNPANMSSDFGVPDWKTKQKGDQGKIPYKLPSPEFLTDVNKGNADEMEKKTPTVYTVTTPSGAAAYTAALAAASTDTGSADLEVGTAKRHHALPQVVKRPATLTPVKHRSPVLHTVKEKSTGKQFLLYNFVQKVLDMT